MTFVECVEHCSMLFLNPCHSKNSLLYHEVIVPTNDSTRSTYLTKMLLSNDYHVMMPGPTGTGKSINAYNLISSGMG